MNFTDPVAVSVTIHDDRPTASDDIGGTVTEDGAGAPNTASTSTVSGNVIENDTANADTPKAFDSWGSNASAVDALNTYGTLTLGNDGTWSYALDNTRGATQALTSQSHLSFDLAYTMRDADGDTSSAILTITIDGADDCAAFVTASAQGADCTVF